MKNYKLPIIKRILFSRLLLIFISFIIYNSSLIILPPHARAIEDLQTITIKPAIELSMKAGESTSGKLPLINESKIPITFTFEVRDITVDNNKGIPKIITSDQLQILSQWVKLSQNGITLQPGERTELAYYIELPPNLLPGGYYASILYQTGLTSGSAEAKVRTQLGTLVYLTVEGDYLKDAYLKSFNLPSFQEHGPISPSFEIHNAGTIHINPKVTLRINSFMRDEITIDVTRHNIFPGSTLLYEQSFGKKWMMGMYTIDLEAVYGEHEGQKITFQRTVLLFPWKIALLSLFILNGVVFTITGLVHYARHKDAAEFPKNGPPHPFPTPKS